MEAVAKRRPPEHRNGAVVVIVPSAPKVYMSADIPYPFRQNTDFLYLCGFQEPDSILVLESPHSPGDSMSAEHTSTLFVPKKDARKELWDGPRSGTNGSVQLTGVDRAFNIDEFGQYLSDYTKSAQTFATWYDHMSPTHVEFHLKHLANFIRDGKNLATKSPRILVQALRLIKSPAEAELMKQTCEIASKSFAKVMKFSKPGVGC